jgi:hypothetical protein
MSSCHDEPSSERARELMRQTRAAWDERARLLAADLRTIARTHTVLAVEARQLAFSLEELVGLFGMVSQDYVAELFSRALGLASVVRSPSDEADAEEEQTNPGTPGAIRRARSEAGPSSGLRRVLEPRKDTSLRLRAG